jgi:hypothetical protein
MKTTYPHLGGYAATNGEVNYRCHEMWNSNVELAPNLTAAPTLKARRRSTGAWHVWAEHYNFSTDVCFRATRYYTNGVPVSGTALDYSTYASTCPWD